LDPQKLLGLSAGATPEEVAQARRRFAAAFHSDRTSQLPDWVGELFDQLLGAVNAACDRSHR
jgi:curved DNA-binding protein CbpA